MKSANEIARQNSGIFEETASYCKMILVGTRLFIGGMPAKLSRDDIIKRFSSIGVILECWAPKQEIGRLRNFAYITFETTQEAQKCRKAFHGTKWMGNKIRVEPARPDHLERLKARWVLEKQESKVQEPPQKRKLLFQNYPLTKRRKVDSSDSDVEKMECQKDSTENEDVNTALSRSSSNNSSESGSIESFEEVESPKDLLTEYEEQSGGLSASFLYKGRSKPTWDPKPASKPAFLLWKKKESVKAEESSKTSKTATEEEIEDFLAEESSESSSEKVGEDTEVNFAHDEQKLLAEPMKAKPAVKRTQNVDHGAGKEKKSFSKLDWKSFYNENWEPHKMEQGLSGLLGFSHVPVDGDSNKQSFSTAITKTQKSPSPERSPPKEEGSSDEELAGSMFMRTEEQTKIQKEFDSKRTRLLKMAKRRGV